MWAKCDNCGCDTVADATTVIKGLKLCTICAEDPSRIGRFPLLERQRGSKTNQEKRAEIRKVLLEMYNQPGFTESYLDSVITEIERICEIDED